MTARPETVAAAAWWAKQLATPTHHDTGDAPQTGLLNAASRLAGNTYTPDQVEAFRVALLDRIEAHLANESWVPDNPIFGAAMRCIHNDYGIDLPLREAAEIVGIKVGMFDLPLKTVMWIDPGSVTVRQGYGDVETIWSRSGVANA